MKTYRQLFAIREFRVLFLVQCLNIGSYAVASLALGTITFAATGSPVLTALAMFGAPLHAARRADPLRLRLRPRAAAHRPRGRRRRDDRDRPAAGDPGPARGAGASPCSRVGAAHHLGPRRQHDGARLRHPPARRLHPRPGDDEHRGRRHADRRLRHRRPAPHHLHDDAALPRLGRGPLRRGAPAAPRPLGPPAARMPARRSCAARAR